MSSGLLDEAVNLRKTEAGTFTGWLVVKNGSSARTIVVASWGPRLDNAPPSAPAGLRATATAAAGLCAPPPSYAPPPVYVPPGG